MDNLTKLKILTTSTLPTKKIKQIKIFATVETLTTACLLIITKDNQSNFCSITLTLFPTDIYLLKVNNRNTRARCEICSKLTKFWCLYC